MTWTHNAHPHPHPPPGRTAAVTGDTRNWSGAINHSVNLSLGSSNPFGDFDYEASPDESQIQSELIF